MLQTVRTSGRAVAIAMMMTLLMWSHSSEARGDEPVTGMPESIRVGIIVVAAINLPEADAVAYAEQLGEVLEVALTVDAIAGSEASGKLRSPVTETCVSNRSCIDEVGSQLDVRSILFLTIVRIGTQIQINVVSARTQSGATEPREPIEFAEDSDSTAAFKQAASKLVPEARPRPEPKVGPEPPDGNGNGNGQDPTTPTGGRGRHMTVASWVAGGVGAAALVTGLGFGVAALRLHGKLDDQCNGKICTDAQADRIADRKKYINTADVFLGVAAAAGLTAGLLYAFSGQDGDTRAVGVTATPGGMGVYLRAEF